MNDRQKRYRKHFQAELFPHLTDLEFAPKLPIKEELSSETGYNVWYAQVEALDKFIREVE